MAAWNPGFAGIRQFRRPGVGARWPFGPSGSRVPRVPEVVKSRKVVYFEGFGHSDRNGPEGRLGPPDSRENTEKPESDGKAGKTPF